MFLGERGMVDAHTLETLSIREVATLEAAPRVTASGLHGVEVHRRASRGSADSLPALAAGFVGTATGITISGMSGEVVIWAAQKGRQTVEGRSRALPAGPVFSCVLTERGAPERLMWACPCNDATELATLSAGTLQDFRRFGWALVADATAPQ